MENEIDNKLADLIKEVHFRLHGLARHLETADPEVVERSLTYRYLREFAESNPDAVGGQNVSDAAGASAILYKVSRLLASIIED